MGLLQIIIIIFAVFALSRSLLRIRDKEISRFQFLFWVLVWLTLILVTLIPDTARILSKPLGIDRAVDFMVYFSIILLFYLIFRIYVKVEKISQDLTKLVRQMAKK